MSDEEPRSTFSLGQEIVDGSSFSPDQKNKVRRQMNEMKTELEKLSQRASATKPR